VINGWSLVYKKAVNKDGSLLFPERLSKEHLEQKRRVLGSYIYANQYQNEIIPVDMQTFKPEWKKYHRFVPDNVIRFGFIDPAISEEEDACYTGITVVAADQAMNWYVEYAKRERLNPSQIISRGFDLCDRFGLKLLGVEDVAFQRVIVHFANEQMRKMGKRYPMVGIKRGNDKTKEQRILSLVPRFEFGSIFLAQGLHDLEEEMDDYPRGAYRDTLDSLASIEDIVHYPQKPRSRNAAPNPNEPGYESHIIQQLIKRANDGGAGGGEE
jgi:predicted phage terminase large subunit-like protein